MTLTEQKVAAKKFAAKWADRGDEKQDTRSFWEEFMEDVLGIEGARDIIKTEYPVDINGHQKYIDVFYQEQEILIEQKSFGKALNKRYHQSGGDMLTPFEQGRRYAGYLPYGINARWVIVCNFQQFEIHDLKKPGEAPIIVDLDELDRHIGLFRFFVSDKNEDIIRETEISKDAGEVVGRLYDALKEKYVDPENEETQRHLNILVTRLVFCMYAEDAGLFGDEPNRFLNYIKNKDPESLGEALERLFRVLDMPESQRNQKSNISPSLKAFPYVNGGLFKEEDIEIPLFDDSLKRILVEDACAFNWADISPTIFGAVFESTLNPETRRSGGMHYTSIENIHKVIDPLFLDDLKKELREIQATAEKAYYKKRLLDYQDKLANIKLLDPACGSGNFLTESYLCLRKLENIVFSELISKKQIEGQMAIAGIDDSVYQEIKVSISQFYGIEINDFAVTVAKTALWIAEAQMYDETRNIFFQIDQSLPDFFPLTTNATIVEGNALRMDWNDVIKNNELTYIMGNPPFVGKSFRTPEQKKDMQLVFDNSKGHGNLDYVACWYRIAAEYMENTNIRCAYVSTNSICQGIAVPPLWDDLLNKRKILIHFAHQTFRWENEASDNAGVHCVIIGFSYSKPRQRYLYNDDGMAREADNINAYLLDAPDIIIKDRHEPLSNVPKMAVGSFPTDGGYLVLKTQEEYDAFVKAEPRAKPFIRPYIGPEEFLKNKARYCLWLKGCDFATLQSMPHVVSRVKAVREYRLDSKKEQTRRRADIPSLFAEDRQPDTDYILVPRTSSENRKYIPMGFLPKETIAGDTIILPNATLFHFGVLTSNVHMAWMRVTAGRLEMRYRYSNTLVYNTFIWPDVSSEQYKKISETASAILSVRDSYKSAQLASLYDESLMPLDLRRAHQANDMAVMEAYGFYNIDDKGKKHWYTEEETVAALMKMYQKLTQPDEISTDKKQKATVKVKVHKKK